MKNETLKKEMEQLATLFFELYTNKETKDGPINDEGWLISGEQYRTKILEIESKTPYRIRFLEVDDEIKWHIAEPTKGER